MSEVLFSIGETGQNLDIQFYDELSINHHLIVGCREAAHHTFAINFCLLK